MIARKKQLAVAETIITATLNNNIKSVENQENYTKIVDPAAHASIWIKNENIFNQYKNYFSMGSYFYNYGGYRNRYYTDTTDGFNSAINIFFEKDKMRMNQKTFSTNAELAQLGTAVMNSKQNTALLNYINPDNIGYFSMSINTAMANYYYTFLKKYMNSTPYMNEYSDAINVYIDLLEILIDEKGIADLMPGNYLFVMHDMKNKLVTYTDYDYDKEFNKKEIKKTKNELSPNFTFVMETKKEAFMKKVANLPLKYAKKEGYNYKDKGGYYELAFKEGEMPISSLYFMIKDGKGIVSTSMDVITSTLNNTALYAPSEEAKNSILSNNYSLNINSKKLLEKIGPELSSNANKKVNDYLLENFGDIKMESSLKDGA
ncbi:MAG: hypothetical protein IPP48_01345 [Chitinophagaceae bacterium]|nr:hypothetical protein [Chitinophagaceae bacterium]